MRSVAVCTAARDKALVRSATGYALRDQQRTLLLVPFEHTGCSRVSIGGIQGPREAPRNGLGPPPVGPRWAQSKITVEFFGHVCSACWPTQAPLGCGPVLQYGAC